MSNVTGWNEVSAGLKLKKAKLDELIPKALGAAGLFLQGQSQRLVPVDFGILKASAFTRAAGKGSATVVNVGYTANYAMFVHEMPSGLDPARFGRERQPGNPSRGHFWDPSGRGQSKFLEAPARDSGNRTKMLAIVRNACRIAPDDEPK